MALFYETKSCRYFCEDLHKIIDVAKYLSDKETRNVIYLWNEIFIMFGIPTLLSCCCEFENFDKVILKLDWEMRPNHPTYRIEYR